MPDSNKTASAKPGAIQKILDDETIDETNDQRKRLLSQRWPKYVWSVSFRVREGDIEWCDLELVLDATALSQESGLINAVFRNRPEGKRGNGVGYSSSTLLTACKKLLNDERGTQGLAQLNKYPLWTAIRDYLLHAA
jgi:hypothetical protein